MVCFYKRLKTVIVAVLTFLITLCCGCDDNNLIIKDKDKFPTLSESGLSVIFMDVGQGDCTIIKLPDGKIMIIDTGDVISGAGDYILQTLSSNNVSKIDYLVLTHTDVDHIGNTVSILDKVDLGKAYLPYLLDTTLFPYYENALEVINEKAQKTYYSEMGRRIYSEDFNLYFLMPLPKDKMGQYDDLNYGDGTADQINAVSAVIYLEYKGVKFIFSGDTTYEVENLMVEYNESGFYGMDDVDIENVDFLKVSHHGGSEEINEKFYEALCPKNAVISVGALNNYNHPSTYTLMALEGVNPNINILRTDVDGTVSVYVDNNGKVEVLTEKQTA